MKIVKITVLETSIRENLVAQYGNPNMKPCEKLRPGQVFFATNTCPKGLCDCAWRTMNQYVFGLSCGVRRFYGDLWTNRDGIAVVTCNDGFRPVTFLLEATEEEAGPFYQQEAEQASV
ncbi:MAG: TIGR04076 family protein [Alistipes sp.]|nr:TIGR04076 family protein [Alistipes sp.]